MCNAAFSQWYEASGLTLQEAAAKFDVDFGTVGKWVRGEVTPHRLRWKEIERITRKAVPASSWLGSKPDTRERIRA